MTLWESLVYLREWVASQKKLLEDVTEGPWRCGPHNESPRDYWLEGGKYEGPGKHFLCDAPPWPVDAKFICSSRTSLPALLGACEAMLGVYDQECDSLRAVEYGTPPSIGHRLRGMEALLISFAESLENGMEGK